MYGILNVTGSRVEEGMVGCEDVYLAKGVLDMGVDLGLGCVRVWLY